MHLSCLAAYGLRVLMALTALGVLASTPPFGGPPARNSNRLCRYRYCSLRCFSRN